MLIKTHPKTYGFPTGRAAVAKPDLFRDSEDRFTRTSSKEARSEGALILRGLGHAGAAITGAVAGVATAKLALAAPLAESLGPFFASATLGGALGALAGAVIQQEFQSERPMTLIGAATGTSLALCASLHGVGLGMVGLTVLGAVAGLGIAYNLSDRYPRP